MVAIARITTMVPVFSERPSSCKREGQRDQREAREQQRPVFLGGR